MAELRVILDKSVVHGLSNPEIDSVDRYFSQIIPPILINEILAELTKEAETPTIVNRIASHSYRISGNRVITPKYWPILIHSLIGNEPPMDGRCIPLGEKTVRSEDGFIGGRIETSLEDETIARWERKQFTEKEKTWAAEWRERMEKPLRLKLYLENISKAGLEFTPPKSDEDLVAKVDSLLQERSLQVRLFPLLSREHSIPIEYQDQAIKRWFKEGRPLFKDFARYAFFCLRAGFIWTLGLTNRQLFKPDKNDRKDLEYCYHLPHSEIFVSGDNKHKRLVPFLLRSDQSFVNQDDLKADLKNLSDKWDTLSREEKIQMHAERGHAPPEDENSLVFQLWKKHRNKIVKPIHPSFLKMKVVDTRLPEEEQVPITFEEFLRKMMKETKAASEVLVNESAKPNPSDESDEKAFLMRSTKISKKRLLKMYPQLTEEDLKDSD